MGLGTFEIVLENAGGVFYSGQNVTGVVNITITGDAKKVRGMKSHCMLCLHN